ncbi:hypothetical protein [Cetobacterium ceti]
MRKIEAILGTVLVSFVLAYYAYQNLYKINPRSYLNNRVSTIYANEGVTYKNLKVLEDILGKSDIDAKGLSEIGTYLENIYIISKNEYFTREDSVIGILDPGFMYPIVLLKCKKYFHLDRDGVYILKVEYREKYKQILKNQDLFMVPDRGNLLLGTRDRELLELAQEEHYLNPKIVGILEKERAKNLGVFMVNLDRIKLLGFDKLFISGNINKDYLTGELVVGGNNRIIKSFVKYKNSPSQEKQPLVNGIYISENDKNDIDDFFMFLGYFLKGYDLGGKLKEKPEKTPYKSQEKKGYINIMEDQFFYGNMYLNNFINSKNDLGTFEISGYAKSKALIFEGRMKTKNLIRVIKEMEIGGQNDKNIQYPNREIRRVQTS